MLAQSSVFAQLITFADQLVRLIAWPILIGLVWKLRGKVDEWVLTLVSLQTNIQESNTLIAATKDLVDKVTANHLKHIEEAVLAGNKQHMQQLEVLQDIRTSMEILKDR